MHNIIKFLNPGTIVGAILCSLIAGISLSLLTIFFSKMVKRKKKGAMLMDRLNDKTNDTISEDNSAKSNKSKSGESKPSNAQKKASIHISGIDLKHSKIEGGFIIGSGNIQEKESKK